MTENLLALMKEHSVAIFFALAVGILSIFPYIAAPIALGGEYKGILLPSSDEGMYRARVHEILDGHSRVASPYFYEYKGVPTGVPPVSEHIYALPAMIFGLSTVITAAKFVLPVVLFFFIYFFMLALSGGGNGIMRKWHAITGALLITLGFDFVNYRSVLDVLMGGAPGSPRLLIWTRFINPITGAVLLFPFLLCLWWTVRRKYRYAYVGAGFLLALMVGYFFSFGIALAILAVLLTVFFVRKEYVIARELFLAFAISAVLDAWFWYNTALSLAGENGDDFALRNGMNFTHAPVVNKMLVVAAIFTGISFLYSYFVRRSREHTNAWIFLLAFILGGFLAFNQQVITGREVWFDHFVLYTVPLSYIAILTAAYFAWRPLFPRLWLLGTCTIATASLAWGVFSASSYVHGLEKFEDLQRYGALFAWVESHAEHDCVILVKEPNIELDLSIPAYTGCNVYISTYPFFGPPPERILHHYLLRLRLNGVVADEIDAYLSDHEGEIRSYFFDTWRQALATGKNEWLNGKIEYISEGYRWFMRKNLKEQILTYKFDYLVSETPLQKDISDELPGMKLVARAGTFFVYEFSE